MMNELNFLDSLLGNVMDAAISGTSGSPCVDVIENNDSYSLEMELPGRNENDVSIELDHNNLTIASVNEDKKTEKENKNTKYVLKERKNFNFKRSFTLPKDVDTDSISANFKNGVLTVYMQKKAKEAPKKILIEAC